MKKITLVFAAAVLSWSAMAQGNQNPDLLLKYERFTSVKTALANASSEEDKYKLGLAELGLGNVTAAQQIFNSISGSEYGQAGLARIELLKGNKAGASSILDKIVDGAKRRETHKYIIAADAITYTETKGELVDKAIEWYKKALEREQTPELYISLGDAYLLKGDALSNGEAQRNFEYAIEKQSNHSLAHSRKGLLMYRARNFEKAIEYFKIAQQADPNNPLVYRDLANGYYNGGNFNLAKENIEKYLQLSDATEADQYQYLNILFLSKDYDNTLIKLDEIFAKNPNPKPYLYRVKAYSLSEKGDYVNALSSINDFFAKKTAETNVIYDDYYYKGKILTQLATTDSVNRDKYLAEANTSFENGLKIKDTTKTIDELYTPIAEAFDAAKDYERTANWYGRIVKEKENPNAYDLYTYGLYSYYGGKLDDAFNAFTTMYDKFEKDRYLSEYWRAEVVAKRDDPEAENGAAEQYYLNWLNITYPEGKERRTDHMNSAYQYLAFYYYTKKDKTNAVKYADLILSIKPDSEFAKNIKAQF